MEPVLPRTCHSCHCICLIIPVPSGSFSFIFFLYPFLPLLTIGHYVFTDAELWRVSCSLGSARPKIREKPKATKAIITFHWDEKIENAEERPSLNSLIVLIWFLGSLRMWMSKVNSELVSKMSKCSPSPTIKQREYRESDSSVGKT